MADLIDRQALLATLEYDPKKRNIVQPKSTFGIILAAPAVDAVEVKRGLWKHTDEAAGWFSKDECSECGYHHAHRYDLSFFNYCPNCGAKMDVEGT